MEDKVGAGTLGIEQLSDNDFTIFSKYIYDLCGIKLPPIKKTMLSARLQKRLRHLKLYSFREYLDYLLSPAGQADEICHLIDVVSTNKTDFFREAVHFDILTGMVLPEIIQRRKRSQHCINIWSAGCSTGEEPYTLAMILAEFCANHPGHDFSVLATDISTKVLAQAREAIYADDLIRPIPSPLRYKYLMRGKGKHRGYHRVVPELRAKVQFQRLNFMDLQFCLQHKVDIIFCRNVIIYFDRQTQENLFNKFFGQLRPQGYLFTGHSETLSGINNKMQRLDAAVYQRLQ